MVNDSEFADEVERGGDGGLGGEESSRLGRQTDIQVGLV